MATADSLPHRERAIRRPLAWLLIVALTLGAGGLARVVLQPPDGARATVGATVYGWDGCGSMPASRSATAAGWAQPLVADALVSPPCGGQLCTRP
jgi:hypothetical protein